MLAVQRDSKYRLTLAEMFDCTEITINQLLTNSYQNLIREWQMTSKLLLVVGFKSESDTYYSLHVAHQLF